MLFWFLDCHLTFSTLLNNGKHLSSGPFSFLFFHFHIWTFCYLPPINRLLPWNPSYIPRRFTFSPKSIPTRPFNRSLAIKPWTPPPNRSLKGSSSEDSLHRSLSITTLCRNNDINGGHGQRRHRCYPWKPFKKNKKTDWARLFLFFVYLSTLAL